ncbi:B3/B4 domain-containing protein [Mobilicoccus massiliensis]|uniref:B3/B4 domain-containing protein n=1 Tax=Mobilicoccus massiliensis TaxID=1522310 RepID=UPI00058BB711|nr:phenylalanine--tRNA ligase beta subunit-related protein [Mobilicoccus massiliensis]
MTSTPDALVDPAAWLAAASISPEVAELRPDYRCVLVTAIGLEPGPSDEVSDALLSEAEQSARAEIGDGRVEELGHVAAWREAFRAFGAKPQRTRNSAEALLRRVADGLPRTNRLADAYNAVSVRCQVPLGGENLRAYDGPLRLVRATGEEEFGTLASGEQAVEHPDAGEVVWRDDAGVTCRRWNWRQGHRTRLTDDTADAIFICDVLDVEPGDAPARAEQVRDALVDALRRVGPNASIESRIVAATPAEDDDGPR